MVPCKEMDCGKIKKDKNMLEVGEAIKPMVMGSIPPHKVTTKVILLLYFRLIC